MNVFILILWIVGVLLLFAAAFSVSLGVVKPGWLGLGLSVLAWLLGTHLL